MDKFELQKLRDLPIEGVAERLGLTVKHHKALCPFHEDHHPSLSFSVRKNTYRCFVCGASGGTIDLVMKYLHKNFIEACRWLNPTPFPSPKERGATNQWTTSTSNITNPSPLPSGGVGGGFQVGGGVQIGGGSQIGGGFDASRYERYFERPFLNDEARHFLFEERRLDERVVRWCRLTSWRDKQGVPWLQIPYYDREGKLVGVQNRNLVCGALPRFRFPCGSQCGIYNLPVLNLLRPGDELYIAEGCSDCWSLLSAGHKAIAIPSATLLTKKDKEQLLTLYSNSSPLPSGGAGGGLSMFPDRDAPGERMFLQLKEVLPSLVHHQLPPDCKDYSDYYLRYLCQKC